MTDTNTVRVRFAPSPTGFLHIGSLRTALFNYLFARHNNGKFILRIEDTDRTRTVEGAVESMVGTLAALGLNYDEGPFFQSERVSIYQKYSQELIENQNAYYCFCTPERLEQVRQTQRSRGLRTQYDRHCRTLSAAEIKNKLEKNFPHVIRLKVPLDTEIKFDDIIRGTIRIESDHVDDQVLIKSDGYPTYHLANVVDDHLMQITHIIRGEEWLTSVPKHILIYRFLGWNIPLLAHLPLILNPDKTKLSKRQGDVAAEDFLKKGYLPEALINFIALLGWNPGKGETREVFSKGELINLFTLENVSTSGAVFNREKLNWLNSQYIQNLRHSDLKKLDELMKPYYASYDFGGGSTHGVTYTVSTGAVTLEDAAKRATEEFPKLSEINLTGQQLEIVKSETSGKVLNSFLSALQTIDESDPQLMDKLKSLVKDLQKQTGAKGKDFFTPIRLVLSGKEHGPELAEYIDARLKLDGKEKLIEVIAKYVDY